MNLTYYRCEHFQIEELVDLETYRRWGDRAWMFFRPEALYSLDQIRKYFNRPVIVNNWFSGGQFQWRGLRTSNCPVGGDYSLHRCGAAFDLDVKGISAEEVRQVIIANAQHPAFAKITCLEATVSWVHFDVRNIPNRIFVVYP